MMMRKMMTDCMVGEKETVHEKVTILVEEAPNLWDRRPKTARTAYTAGNTAMGTVQTRELLMIAMAAADTRTGLLMIQNDATTELTRAMGFHSLVSVK
jgi:hypothetical protein